jgi:8-hydroxy-5-deazaflavin:NADPH oxidoreductase
MKVGILGSGEVGKSLAKAFKNEGHDVMIATREPESDKGKALNNELGVKVGGFPEVAQFGELEVLCTKGDGTEDAVKQAGPENLAGKVVIDTTNPLDFSDGTPRLFVGHDDSLAERAQKLAPDAKFVKAFNLVNAADMYKPKFSIPPTMFICGNDTEAKSQVTEIVKIFGWDDVIDMGDITAARYLEPMVVIWAKYFQSSGSPHHTFKLVR